MQPCRDAFAGIDAMVATVAARAQAMSRPFILALDGRSGAGKSTLARSLADRMDAGVIEGDDFYAGGTALRTDSAETRVAACIDRTRQRPVLAALRAGREAVWRAFDWDAFDGRLRDVPVVMTPKPVVIIEGVYAGRPELADLLDLKVLVHVEDALRKARLLAREGGIGPWERQWHEAEDHYFGRIMPPDLFDLILSPNALTGGGYRATDGDSIAVWRAEREIMTIFPALLHRPREGRPRQQSRAIGAQARKAVPDDVHPVGVEQ